jgi:hypothetical protein
MVHINKDTNALNSRVSSSFFLLVVDRKSHWTTAATEEENISGWSVCERKDRNVIHLFPRVDGTTVCERLSGCNGSLTGRKRHDGIRRVIQRCDKSFSRLLHHVWKHVGKCYDLICKARRQAAKAGCFLFHVVEGGDKSHPNSGSLSHLCGRHVAV